MTRRTRTGGYTIIEVLIVMAASSALVLTVIIMISGQQRKTEFYQAIRDADSIIQDVINDFSSGFYLRAGSVSCSVSPVAGVAPVLSGAPSGLGENEGCAYIGRVLQLNANDDFRVHTMIGRQFVTGILSEPVSNIEQAKPVLAFPNPDLSQVRNLPEELVIERASYRNASNVEISTLGAFGIISSFSTTNTTGVVDTKKQTPQIFIPTNFTMSESANDLANDIAALAPGTYLLKRPIAICFRSADSTRYGIIRIGENSGRLTTTTLVNTGVCPGSLF